MYAQLRCHLAALLARRVWFCGGELHIVPLPSTRAPTIPSFPTLTQALALVRSDAVPTRAGAPARGTIF